MTKIISDIEARVGLGLQDHQREAVEDMAAQAASGRPGRLCLYHATGAGKTYTALACVAVAGSTEVLVLAPPVTHPAWREWGMRVGVDVTPISHAKFRMADYKLPSRDTALIVDEFHLLGGQTGKGWRKLARIAESLRAPLVIASATPNYNDAERVYCIAKVIDPTSYRGGFLQFLYSECITRENPFAKTPDVDGFQPLTKGGPMRSAEEFLSTMDRVHYVEDEAIKQVVINDIFLDIDVPDEFDRFGLDRRRGRLVASQMEERHARKRLQLIDDDGLIRPVVYDRIVELVGDVATPTLVFCASATIAEALWLTAREQGASAVCVTGKTTPTLKDLWIQEFVGGEADILIGTATLATGLDGVDKMCDHLLIVDDTDDDSLRRQLMGRILPRGLDTDVSKKAVNRFIYS